MMKMANWPVLNHYDFELVESDYLPSFSFYKFLVVLGGCTKQCLNEQFELFDTLT